MKKSIRIIAVALILCNLSKVPGAVVTIVQGAFNPRAVTGDEVYQQRRLELWGEGFSLFDHLRLKKGVERNYEGSNHLSSALYTIAPDSWYLHFQIPLRELDNSSFISAEDQNPAPTESKFKK